MGKVPVLFTIFNRKDVSVEAFQSIKIYQPDRLYIAADGPRKNNENDDYLCKITRQAVLDEIGWQCDVKTLFRVENKGCAHAMNEAISWFFDQEEWGIIIEDDVIVKLDFFAICEELLPHYATEDRIMEISAQNCVPLDAKTNRFVFTNNGYCWGWASWRRAWRKMDMQLSFWPQISLRNLIKNLGLIQGWHTYLHGNWAYKNINALNTWAFRWHLSILFNHGVVMLSTTNLSKNVGCAIEGAHYNSGEIDLYSHLPLGEICFPLEYPKGIVLSKRQMNAERRDFRRIRLCGLKKKVIRLLGIR